MHHYYDYFTREFHWFEETFLFNFVVPSLGEKGRNLDFFFPSVPSDHNNAGRVSRWSKIFFRSCFEGQIGIFMPSDFLLAFHILSK